MSRTMRDLSVYSLLFVFIASSCQLGADENRPSVSSKRSALRTPPALPANPVVSTPVEQDGFAARLIAGAAGVGELGDAQYSYPLWLPPGRLGMQPSLSLSYSSSGGDGVVGKGWTLTATSQISRCRKTFGHDGERQTVKYNTTDALCLDGRRLLCSSPTACVVEGDEKVHVTVDSSDGAGPISFTVVAEDRRRQYGSTSNSRLEDQLISTAPATSGTDPVVTQGQLARLSWALSKEADRFGNSIEYAYSGVNVQGVERLLETISYTGRPGQQGQRHVRFEYEPRTAPTHLFVAGLKLGATRRVKSISAILGASPQAGDLIRKYNFTYVAAPSAGLAPDLLESFIECDGSGVCARPITFEYERPVTDEALGPYQTLFADHVGNIADLQAGDLNGDGCDDLLIGRDVQIQFGTFTEYELRYAQNCGSPQPVSFDVSLGVIAHTARNQRLSIADLNADGIGDLLAIAHSSASISIFGWPVTASQVRMEYMQGGSYFPHVGAIAPCSDFQCSSVTLATLGGYSVDGLGGPPRDYAIGDAEGDGLPDLLLLHPGSAQAWDWQEYRNLGTTTTQPPVTGAGINAVTLAPPVSTGVLFNPRQRARTLDLDADGAAEFVLSDATGTGWLRATQFRAGQVPVTRELGLYSDETTEAIAFADVFGSGIPAALVAQNQGSLALFAENTGRSYLPRSLHLSTPWVNPIGTDPTPDNGLRLGNVFGMDRADILLVDGVYSAQDREVVVSTWTGSSFLTRGLLSYGDPIQVGDRLGSGKVAAVIFDGNGDGYSDIAQIRDGNMWLHMHETSAPFVLKAVRDGRGTHSFEHAPLVRSDVHTPGSVVTGLSGYRRVTGRMWVVRSFTDTNPVFGSTTTTFKYSGATVDVETGTFRGFASVTRENQTTHAKSTASYRYFPNEGPRVEARLATVQVDGVMHQRSTSYEWSYGPVLHPATGASAGSILVLERETETRLGADPISRGLLSRRSLVRTRGHG